jgi:cytoskeletal protein CcmA (bactofilin family)
VFAKKDIESGPMETLIGPGTRFQGNIRSKGYVRVDGAVEGSVTAEGIIVGEKAQITGDLIGKDVFVGGRVTGNVTAAHSLELQPKSQVVGDIHAAQIAIAEGALFEGNCLMTAEKIGVIEVEELLEKSPTPS